jgi:hypothetical protein
LETGSINDEISGFVLYNSESQRIHSDLPNQTCKYFRYIVFIFFFVFSRNFNKEIFTRRPEFCLLYEKLQKTCKSWKQEALTMKYPDLCSTIVKVKESIVICPVRFANTSVILDPILFRLNGSLLKLRDELYLYARDNLAVVNIYIKDATVTKIRRDQKVTNLSDSPQFFSTNFSQFSS